jgi:hypothetical protein
MLKRQDEDMKCKYCKASIRTPLNAEMQCFPCYNKLKLAKPEKHRHKAKLPGSLVA